MLTVAVLISGTGSNLRALLEAAAEPGFPARIVVVGADRQADGFAHAEAFGIPTVMVPFREFETREEWGDELRRQIDVWTPDLVVLSGLMRLLPAALVDAWAPALTSVLGDADSVKRLGVLGQDRSRAFAWRDVGDRVWSLHAEI